MPAISEATTASSVHSSRSQPTERWLWGGAFLVSLAIHGGLFAGMALVLRAAPQANVESQSASIPVEFVELAPEAAEPDAADTTNPPSVSVGEAIAQPSAPPVESAVTALPVDEQQAAPTVESAEPSPEPATKPAELAEPSPEPEAEPQNSSSPAPEPAESTSETIPDLSTVPQNLEPLSPPSDIPSPPSPPANPVPPSGEPTLSLPQVTVAEAVAPVEITASVSVQVEPSASEVAPAEYSDRQTFTYDPTGESGLAIARCPVVPDVYRFAGETVTLQVQLGAAGGVQAAQVYSSSAPSTTYEQFATCLVENWDFSGLAPANTADTLLVSITIEAT